MLLQDLFLIFKGITMFYIVDESNAVKSAWADSINAAFNAQPDDSVVEIAGDNPPENAFAMKIVDGAFVLDDDLSAQNNRLVRDSRLTETDWWAVSDRTMTAEQTAYRQALRDITTHANWPNLADSDWPTKPE